MISKDYEILHRLGLGTLLDNMDTNLVGGLILKALAEAREHERAECVKICENLHYKWRIGDESGPRECAESIKEKGRKINE